ncbi:8621_t:CDS:2 [Cetraspora pellucida]|uniref:8621_t:CDS:1 n=1 Tax=Cetraspora pellucida TaxID=1433469 RepID=A0A9N8ZFF4_9GLOM|nr:8621_t:CDS:2 [Cetraspora pellucida]
MCSLIELNALVKNLNIVDSELQHVNVEELGFDHPLCSGDILKSKNAIIEICKEFIKNEETNFSVDKFDTVNGIEFEK